MHGFPISIALISTFTQAYAELETDTPGQILGVIHKTDGKSESSHTSTSSAGATGSAAGAGASSGSTRFSSTSSSSQQSTTTPPISEEFTQKAESDDRYSANDETGTYEYRKDKEELKRFYALGFIIAIIAIFIMAQKNTSYLDYERDRTLAEQRAEAIERERSMDMNSQSAISQSRTHSV